MKVDCVGACVGVRGSRIKNIVDELGGERIDIVRWNDSLQVLIPNALQPAQIEEVFLYPRLGRAIVLVKEDQLSLAIGRRGQNVRLASQAGRLGHRDHDPRRAERGHRAGRGLVPQIPDVTAEMVEAFIEEGFLSYDDLTFLEPAELGELAGVTEEEAEEIIAFAEEAAVRVEEETRSRARPPKSRNAANAPARAPRRTATERAIELLAAGRRRSPAEEAPPPSAEQIFGESPAPAESEQPAEARADAGTAVRAGRAAKRRRGRAAVRAPPRCSATSRRRKRRRRRRLRSDVAD